jgi:hypothetical protein
MSVVTKFRVLDADGMVVAGDDLYGEYLARAADRVGGSVVDEPGVQVYPS